MIETALVIHTGGTRLEDRAVVLPLGEWQVVVVADGAGGRSGGAAASEAVVRLVQEALPTVRNLADPQAWCNLLSWIDGEIEADPEAGETTVVVAAVSARRIVGASVGDSEARLFTERGEVELTARQQQKPFLGVRMARPISFELGLWKYTSSERVAEAVRSEALEGLPEGIVDLVRLRSGALMDDIAVVVCRPGRI
jgi:hypothetical protein